MNRIVYALAGQTSTNARAAYPTRRQLTQWPGFTSW